MKIIKVCLSLSTFALTFTPNDLGILRQNTISGFSSQVLAQQSPVKIIQTGTEVTINGKTHSLPWLKWQEGNREYFGVSDIAAEAVLGIELLSTNKHTIQPIRWFSSYQDLPTKFVNPYRYLDITEFAKSAKINLTINENKLDINLPYTQIKNAYSTVELIGERIVIELDKPAFWQLSKGRDQAVIKIEGNATPELISQFRPKEVVKNIIGEEEGDENKPIEEIPEKKPLFTIENKENQTVFTVNLAKGNNIKVNSANPSSLLVDIQPSAMTPRKIKWSRDISFEQKYLVVSQDDFPLKRETFFVSYLTLDLAKSNLDLKPITTNSNNMIGTAPLTKTAQNIGAIAAINGGFFNRKNMLPLGTVKSENKWFSGAILNRGVIGWNQTNNFKIGRLTLQENILTFNGDRFIINHLNSGYIKAGISRYSPEWGSNYTSLTDNEIVVLIEEDQVIEQVFLGKAGEETVTIPKKGYLLVIRDADDLAIRLQRGMKVKLDSFSIPAEFEKYPNIMGAGPVLLLNGNVVLDGEAEKFSAAFNRQKASRSAIALTNDNRLLLIAVHHRIGGNGPSLLELAKITQALGGVDALNLDGGSSTQIYLGGKLIDRSPATASRVHNGIGIFLTEEDN